MNLIHTPQRPVMLVIDVILTLLAWTGLVMLIVRGLVPMLDTHGGPRLGAPIFAAMQTLQVYFWIAVINGAILITWARYQKRRSDSFAQRRAATPSLSDDALMESFHLSASDLDRLQQPGVLVIHNDEEGGVEKVTAHESRDVERPGLKLVPGSDSSKKAN